MSRFNPKRGFLHELFSEAAPQFCGGVLAAAERSFGSSMERVRMFSHSVLRVACKAESPCFGNRERRSRLAGANFPPNAGPEPVVRSNGCQRYHRNEARKLLRPQRFAATGKTAGSEIDTVNKAYLVGRYIDPIMIDIAPTLAGT